MPAKHRLKIYIEDSYYHVFNGGVNKTEIFLESSDYSYFMSLIERYLAPRNNLETKGEYPNFSRDVSLVAFCLMPNHFHFLLHQTSRVGMTQFMRAICTSYTMYFNRKYERVGPLFQGVFKAIYIVDDTYLLHLSRYIHRNPKNWALSPYSSYQVYASNNKPQWLQNGIVLDQFLENGDSYQDFVASYEKTDKNQLEVIY